MGKILIGCGLASARRRVPMVFLANLLGFGKKPYFEAVEGAEEAPRVEF